ncbi:CK1 family protein kinase [Tritrichomonas foetus]|uniref:non-specific serine/threonine protein kinase n=1 Tax=Tritrichomonas foetus TaxID=1144522 RepID=A0A1J4JT68_9EUKA|nr:CK1 family protein kinase [Tritrichomonas foetus]|eukprot:OHT00692.1 CK1 family protein kinase [Tritrichomonas foetus]
MRTGMKVGRFTIGPQIGQGAFGKIFAVRDSETGLLYAIKNESAAAERKTLNFETKVLRRIQESPYFPRLFDTGETNSLDWIAMELVGPSLSSIVKHLDARRLSLSSGIRIGRHVLRAIQSLHMLGFIHRDIKPANVLMRLTHQPGQPPICLIDFGLVRVFRDQRTKQHEKPRQRTGFRGTKTYASLNAHSGNDLSRRDDLTSWFYFLLDVLLGTLPWKGVSSNVDVAVLKNRYDVQDAVKDLDPLLYDIWSHIASLAFESDPDYNYMLSILDQICSKHGFKEDDPYDWADYIEQYRKQLANEFGVALRIDSGADVMPYYTELGVPPIIMQQIDGKKNSLKAPLIRGRGRNYSVMQLSELNEKDDTLCCCC